MKKEISKTDLDHLILIRKNVSDFLNKISERYEITGRLLDIAPQDHEGAKPYFPHTQIDTLDIDPKASATYTADLCNNNEKIIPADSYDFVVCTEVLEHTLNPFEATREIYRILKKGGLVFITTPFNFRIHGPLPDCWRFTEHGIRAILKDFEIIELEAIETRDRWLMPVHYSVIARKK